MYSASGPSVEIMGFSSCVRRSLEYLMCYSTTAALEGRRY